MQMHQGEQYSIPVKITASNGTVITTENCEDVRIKINDVMKSYSDEELTFDSTNSAWLYPVTEEETMQYGKKILVEAAVLCANNVIVKTPVVPVLVGATTITEMWT